MQYDRNAWIANAARIECSAENFQRFEWDTKDRDKYAVYYAIFFFCLKDCSDKRAMHRGHDNLWIDAARKYVRFVQHLAEQYYAERGHVVRWTERDLKAVAVEIAERMARNPVFANHANAWLKLYRSNIYVKPEVMAEVQSKVTLFDPHRDVNKDKWHVDDGNVETKAEDPIDTFTRTLDYFERIKHLPAYPSLYPIKRELTSLVRIANSLLD